MERAGDDLDWSTLPRAYREAFEARQVEAAALAERNAQLEQHNARLEHLLAEFQRALYGKRSEKLSDDDRQLAFEDLESALAEVESEGSNQPGRPRSWAGSAKRNIGHLPADLPRIERVIEPDTTACPCGCGTMARIGEDRSERLDIVPATVRVLVTVRPRYACRTCEAGVVQAPAPAHLIEGALPSEATLAHVLVAKYADHTPLYRQAQILKRSGLNLDRSTLADWVGKAAFHLAPVVDRLAEHLKASPKLFMDGPKGTVAPAGPRKPRRTRRQFSIRAAGAPRPDISGR